ncbi:MAG: glutathione S-transferase family protein [Polyangiales bacterium]
MQEPVRIVGSYLSPYVRKALVVLDLKGIAYEIDPIIPFMGDDRFSQISPVRRVPVLMDDRVTLADSSVICQYLEDRYPVPPLYPKDVAERAQARWLEEYADTRMGDVFIWRLFNAVAINPYVWGTKTDPRELERIRLEEMPLVFDYLESQLPSSGYVFGDLSIADVSIASFFRNVAFSRYALDAVRWPLTAAFVERVLELESFRKLMPFEERLIRTPIAQHREVLSAMGAPLMADTYGTLEPRPGILPI